MSDIKFCLLCQGLTADEIHSLTSGFDCSQLSAVVVEDTDLPQEFKKSFSFDLYESIEKLLEQVKPDMICVFGVSAQQLEFVSSLLNSGISVILGTPIIHSVEQIKSLASLAERSNARLCINYSELFGHSSSRSFDWKNHIHNRGNERIHVRINLNSQIPRFRSYVRHNQLHWCYELPCGVFHQELEKCLNLIHPLVGEVVSVVVSESSNGWLPQNISDELLVEIEGSRTSATIEIKISAQSSCREVQLSSSIDETRIRQNEGDECVLVSGPGKRKFAERALVLASNLLRFLKPSFGSLTHSVIIEEAACIYSEDPDTPTNSANIERYNFIHDTLAEVARQLSNTHLRFDNHISIGGETPDSKRVLITGASGMFGKRLSKYLNDRGYVVRALIRKLSDCSYFRDLGIEYYYGDVVDTVSLRQAFEDVNYVVHAAADTSGELEVGELSTVQGTRNIVEYCSQLDIERLVYISSCSVYDVSHLRENAEIEESSLLEQFPERRGGYTITKLKADLLVQEAISGNRANITCLRPGTYISENGPFFTPMVGVRFLKKIFVVFGPGKLILPLVFIENLCSATELSLNSNEAKGETFNVIDGLSMSKKAYLEKVLKKLYPNARFILFPYKLLYFLIYLQEVLFGLLRRKPYLTRYRLESSQKDVRYQSSKIKNLLEWVPPFCADEAIERILLEQKGLTEDGLRR